MTSRSVTGIVVAMLVYELQWIRTSAAAERGLRYRQVCHTCANMHARRVNDRLVGIMTDWERFDPLETVCIRISQGIAGSPWTRPDHWSIWV